MSHPYLGSNSQDSYGSPRSIPGSARTGGSATPRDDRFNTPRMYTARSNSTDDTFTSPRTWSENGSEYGTPRQGYPTSRGGPGSARGGPSPRVQPSPRQVRQQQQQCTTQQGNGQPYYQDLHAQQISPGSGQYGDQSQYGYQPQYGQDNRSYNFGASQSGGGYFQNAFAQHQQQQLNGLPPQQLQATFLQQQQYAPTAPMNHLGHGAYDQQQYTQHQYQQSHQSHGYAQQQHQNQDMQQKQYQHNSHHPQYPHHQPAPGHNVPIQQKEQQPRMNALADQGLYSMLREQHLNDTQFKETFDDRAHVESIGFAGDDKDGYDHRRERISPDTSADYGSYRNHPDLQDFDAKADAKHGDNSGRNAREGGHHAMADAKWAKAEEDPELAYRKHLASQQINHDELTLNEEYELREKQKRQLDSQRDLGAYSAVTEAEVSLEQVYAAGMSDKDVDDIFSYARHGRVDEIERLLDKGIPVDVRDTYGNTLLTIACQNGNKRVAKCVLRRAANINSRNNKGNTPLHYCYSYGYGDTLGAYLITKGADVHTRNLAGKGIYDGI